MRSVRLERGWKLIDLTRILGHDSNYFGDIESGLAPAPRHNTLLLLCRLLQISAEDALVTSAYTERLRYQLGLLGKGTRKNKHGAPYRPNVSIELEESDGPALGLPENLPESERPPSDSK